MPTVTEQFENNTSALNALTTQVNALLNDPIDADSLKGIGVDLTGLNDGDIIALKYDQTNNEFAALKLGIDENFKIDLSGIQEGYILKWNATESIFFAVSSVAGGENSSANYAPIQKIKVVPGDLISFFAGISEILYQGTLIPVQNGDSSQIIKGSWYGSNFPWFVFDSNSQSFWSYYENNLSGARIGFDFGVGTQVGGYSFQVGIASPNPVPNSMYVPKSWVVEGSDDGVTWTIIQTVTGESGWISAESRFYGFSAIQAYQQFRLRITDASTWLSTGNYYFFITNLQFYPDTIKTDSIKEVSGSINLARNSKIYGLSQYNSEVFTIAGFAEEADKIFAIDSLQRSLVRDIELSINNFSVIVNQTQTEGQFKFETIITEHSGQIVSNPTTGIGYVAIDNQIFAYNLTSGNLVATIDCQGNDKLQGMVISGNKLYACSTGTNAIAIVDLLTNIVDAVLTNAEGTGNAPWGIALHSGQGNIYATFKDSNQVGVFDVVTDSIITTIAVGAKPTGIVVSETLDRAVVVNSAGGIVSIINTTSNSVIASVPVGISAKPSAAAIDAANNKAFIACEGYHQVVVIDLSDNSLESRIPVEPEPFDLVWVDATSELYCSSQNGTITILAST